MSSGVLSYLRRLLPAAGASLADEELLHRFAACHEQTAFTELLRRYGPLVWGVCRRVLGDAHAAEDAFQATFLQLVQRAGTLRGGSLSGWLHTVATRLAQRARRAEERRRHRERGHVAPPPASADEVTWRELRQILDAEIARLPEPYRQPLLLCYLENRTQSEVAHRLGLSPSVLRGRLERGRQNLRGRLEKLGLPLAAALLLTNTDAVPAALGVMTRQMVMRVLAGAPAPSAVSALLTGGTLFSRLKFGVVAVVLLVAGGIGMGGARRQAQPPAAAPPASEKPLQPQRGVDALGDPLPPGAIRRLGTLRHRILNWPQPWQSLPEGQSYLALHSVLSSGIRRLDAVTGRVLQTWPVPESHHVAGFSPDGRYALLANYFLHHTGLQPLGQKEEIQQWKLTLYDLTKRKAAWQQEEDLTEKKWKHVEAACFSRDGKWIATIAINRPGSLRLWDAGTGKELWNREQSRDILEPLGFVDSGHTVVLRDEGNRVYLFDRARGKELRSFPTVMRKETKQYGVAPDGSGLLFGTAEGLLRVWDVATGRERKPFDGPRPPARHFAFAPDGETIVTGSGRTVRLRDWPSGAIVRTLDLGRGNIERMAISGDGRLLEVMFSGEQELHIYDLKTSKRLPLPVDGHRAGVHGVAIAPDGTLLSFGKDAAILTWSLTTGKPVGQLAVEKDLHAGGFALSGDGRLLATSSSADQVIDVYERATGKRLHRLKGEQNVARHLVFSPDGHWLAGDQRYGEALQVWDVATGRSALSRGLKVVYGITCAFSPDGRQFAASEHGTVRFWDVGSWKERAGLRAFAPLGLAYSPDGRTLATASVEGVRLYELATRRERAHFRPEGHPTGVLRFSSSGRYLAWTGHGTNIHVWDVVRGEMLATFAGHVDTVTDLAFTADERALVSSSEDTTLLVWDVAGAAAKKPSPGSRDVEKAWQSLATEDATIAYEAIRTLAASPDAVVKLLALHLKPAAPLDAKRIDVCLRDLDSDNFAIRDRATRELERFGEQAVPALERFLAGKPSLEARRRVERVLEKIRAQIPQGERLRQIRALEALERIGDDDARRLLEALAKGSDDAPLTRDAKASLARMRD